MPNRCVIMKCDLLNKHFINRNFFKFPNNTKTKENWLSIIPKEALSITPSTYSRICSIHFEKKFIRTHSSVTGETLKYYQLTENAIPSLFFDPEQFSEAFTTHSYLLKNQEIKTKNISSINQNNIQMVCRACLCDKKELLKSFMDNSILLDMYVGCTFLQVEIGDGLPMNLCAACVNKCSAWYSFKQLCEQNELLLRNELNLIKINNDLEIKMIKEEETNEIDIFEEVNIKTEIIDDEDCLNVNSMPELLNLPTELITVNAEEENKNVSSIPVILSNSSTTIIHITEQKSSKCDKCWKTFKNQKRLEDHQRNFHAIMQCEICKKEFPNKQSIRTHMRNIHTAIKRYSCKFCEKKFRTNSVFIIHMRNHTGERPFKCNICNNKYFTSKGNLDSHMRCHSDKKHYLCSTCGKSFKKCSGYKAHLLIHTGERPYSCKLCNRTFKAKICLTKHLKKHQEIQNNDTKFGSTLLLNNKCSKLSYNCFLCEKTFSSDRNLYLHLKNHPNSKQFICTICGQSFVKGTELSLHLQSHTDQRLRNCSICGKVFKKNYDLKTHLLGHTGERPFKCDLCTESFRSRKMLTNHNLKKHGNKNNSND